MFAAWVENCRLGYKHYYQTLKEREKTAYNKLFSAIMKYDEWCEVPYIQGEDYGSVYTAVMEDNPMFFFVSSVNTLISPLRAKLQIRYRYTMAQLEPVIAELEAAIGRILRQNKGLPQHQIEKNIHDYLVANVTYENDDRYFVHQAISPFLYKKSVCEGFSKGAKLLFDRLGVDCVVITGNSSEPNDYNVRTGHAWNAVRIDGAFYHIDITFDNTISLKKNHIRYDYFNLSDEQIRTDHIPESCEIATGSGYDYYTRNGQYFAKKSALCAAFERALRMREEEFSFRLPFTADPQTTYSRIMDLLRSELARYKWFSYRGFAYSFNEKQMVIQMLFEY
jgi:hypothetical protein